MNKTFVFCVLFLLLATNVFAKQQYHVKSVYNITGAEYEFKSDSLNKVYNITGAEQFRNVNTNKTSGLTDIQKAKLEYFEMEANSKISALEKDLQTKRKIRDNEIAKQNCDVYFIDELTEEIKLLVTDIEKVIIETKKKTRNILFSNQYIQYELERNKKLKKKSKNN